MMWKRYAVAITAVLVALMANAAWSQTYPTRPIRVIVPFGPGAPDSVARIVSQQMSAQMGQPFVIDNRPGANGIIGNDLVAKSAPDGYVLLLTSVSYSVNPSMQKKMPYDSLRDLIAISNVADQEANILIVNPQLPINSVKELIAYAKQPGAKLSYASIGIGNTTHLAGELFLLRAGIKATHIPYKGGAQAVAAVMSGEVQMMIVPPTQSISQIRAGRVRALAYTYRTRAALLPDVPTIAEAGVPGAEFDGGWFGFFAPAGTPRNIIQEVATQARTALGNAQVRERLAALGLRPIGTTPEEFQKFVADEIKHFAEIVRMTGIEPE